MKPVITFSTLMLAVLMANGCTRIEKMTPTSGPAGSTIYVQVTGMWGDPAEQYAKWDGETISDPFPGSFTVPAVCEPGEHKVTVVDGLDADEAFLLFPIFRIRHSSATFTVTGM